MSQVTLIVVLFLGLLSAISPGIAQRISRSSSPDRAGLLLPLWFKSLDRGVIKVPEKFFHIQSGRNKEVNPITRPLTAEYHIMPESTEVDMSTSQIKAGYSSVSTEGERNQVNSPESTTVQMTSERALPQYLLRPDGRDSETLSEMESRKNTHYPHEDARSYKDQKGKKDIKWSDEVSYSSPTDTVEATMKKVVLRRSKRQDGHRHAVEGRALLWQVNNRGRIRPSARKTW